jgi:hypothetical protein
MHQNQHKEKINENPFVLRYYSTGNLSTPHCIAAFQAADSWPNFMHSSAAQKKWLISTRS